MKIDVKKLFNTYGLDVENSARKLFPRNSYPVKALSRVFKNQSLLDSAQLVTLSELTGLTINQLYEPAPRTKYGDDFMIVLPNNVRAVINSKEGVTRIFKDGTKPVEVWHGAEITVGDYFGKVLDKTKFIS